jgi:NAD(P)-dependent dehydrogenase (short-subunit alcohol dehydrogenase family)
VAIDTLAMDVPAPDVVAMDAPLADARPDAPAGDVGFITPGDPGTADVRFTVHSGMRARAISRYIYGTNQPDWAGRARNLTFARVGGNRLTAYNWENNASNAGTDYVNQNDAYLCSSAGCDRPGEVVRRAVEPAHAANAAILVTVPIGGYVAADKNGGGDVNRTPMYLTTRFRESLPRKGAPFTLTPDSIDARVYQDRGDAHRALHPRRGLHAHQRRRGAAGGRGDQHHRAQRVPLHDAGLQRHDAGAASLSDPSAKPRLRPARSLVRHGPARTRAGGSGMFTNDTLANKVIVVTGGGTGLGLSMARHLARVGASVVLAARNADRLEAAAQSIRDEGGRALAVPTDVRDREACKALVDRAVAEFGRVDGLINNAAGNFLCAAEDLTPNGFDAVVKIVLYGTVNCTLEVGRHLLERGAPGAILSIVTTYAWTGSAFVLPSAVAKAGVLAMTRSLAAEWGHANIRVNAIAPGPFPTEGAWKALMPTPELEEKAKQRIPLRRFGEHEELTSLVVFMMSDLARFQTGDCVTIDGGEWLTTGGEFNSFTRFPREGVREMLRAMKGK